MQIGHKATAHGLDCRPGWTAPNLFTSEYIKEQKKNKNHS